MLRGHRLLVCLGLLTLTILAGGAGWWRYEHWKDERLRERADQALETFEFEKAEQYYDQLLRKKPDDTGLWLLAAQAARRAGHFTKASECLEQIRDRTEEPTPEVTLERAMLMAQQGKLPEVEKFLTDNLEIRHPQTDLILEALAWGYMEHYRLDESRLLLEILLQRNPDHLTALLLKGQLMETVLNYETALVSYRRAVDAFPQNESARLRLAECLLRYKKPVEADEHFRSLLAAAPKIRASALSGLARSLVERGELDEAKSLLDELLVENPNHGDGLMDRGKLAAKMESDHEAVEYFRRAVAAQPFDYYAQYHLGLCLNRLGKKEESKKHLRKADLIEADQKLMAQLYPQSLKSPRDPSPRYEMGMICLRNGSESEALRWFTGIVTTIAPKHQATHRAMAAIYEKRGDLQNANYHRRQAGDLPRSPQNSAKIP
jgi:tetratricopeptide (TPR) repeat protein